MGDKPFKITKETKIINNTRVTVKKTFRLDVKRILGTIKFETPKAVLLELSTQEVWFPKSVIRSYFKSWSKEELSFYVDSWFLQKNGIIIDPK